MFTNNASVSGISMSRLGINNIRVAGDWSGYPVHHHHQISGTHPHSRHHNAMVASSVVFTRNKVGKTSIPNLPPPAYM